MPGTHDKAGGTRHGPRLRLVILDRDGVINHDSPDYIKSPDEWLPIPGSLDAIARLRHAGVRVTVASNQAGVGRGLFDAPTLMAIHARMNDAVERAGGALDAIFFCPHHPDQACACRKPAPGLVRAALDRFDVAPEEAVAIGDSLRDLQAAAAAGVPARLVLTGNGAALAASGVPPQPSGAPTPVHADLAAAVAALLSGATAGAMTGAAT